MREDDSIEQRPTNKIPSDMVPLEASFNRDNMFTGRIETIKPNEYEDTNVGIETNPILSKLQQRQCVYR